jgi:hypothetical protein
MHDAGPRASLVALLRAKDDKQTLVRAKNALHVRARARLPPVQGLCEQSR